MLADARQFIYSGAWWTYVFPGLAISVTVIGFNLLGDALRDTLDPRRSAGAVCRIRPAANESRLKLRLDRTSASRASTPDTRAFVLCPTACIKARISSSSGSCCLTSTGFCTISC